MAGQPPKFDLITFDALSSDLEGAAKYNKLNILLNTPPKEEWLKTNTMANNTLYIPIGTVEFLLTAIFQQWKVEVKEVKQIANSVVVSVRLHYHNPVTGEWEWQDGIGASPMQTDKGAHAADMSKIKSAAIQMSAPAAESYAVKDAAEKLGKLFGKDLNRKDEPLYTELNDRYGQKKIDAMEEMKLCKTLEELKTLFKSLGTLTADPEVLALKDALKLTLK